MNDIALSLTQAKDSPVSKFLNHWEDAIRTVNAPSVAFTPTLPMELVKEFSETVKKRLVGNRHQRNRLKQKKREAWYRFSVWIAHGRMRMSFPSTDEPAILTREFHVEFHSPTPSEG